MIPRFHLSTLLLLLTISALVVAWIVDRSALIDKIEPDTDRITLVYRVSNAPAGDVIKKLSELYPNQLFLPSKRNSIIVNTARRERDRIEIIIEHLDLRGGALNVESMAEDK